MHKQQKKKETGSYTCFKYHCITRDTCTVNKKKHACSWLPITWTPVTQLLHYMQVKPKLISPGPASYIYSMGNFTLDISNLSLQVVAHHSILLLCCFVLLIPFRSITIYYVGKLAISEGPRIVVRILKKSQVVCFHFIDIHAAVSMQSQ